MFCKSQLVIMGGWGGGGHSDAKLRAVPSSPREEGRELELAMPDFNKTESLSFKHKESVISPFNSTSQYHYQLDRISISYN